MPNDLEGFEDPNTLIEYRGIRGGERGEKAPIKTPPRVRMPTRNFETKKFDVDEKLMQRIAQSMGLKASDWARGVKGIPVQLLTDKIRGEDGVVYLERALYTGRGRLCSSPADSLIAIQKIDVNAYAKNKNIKELGKQKEVNCTDECVLWGTAEKPSDCKWRAIVTTQLLHDPVFPSPTRHRTRSKYSIRAMLTSLKYISNITGGVLMGIPLMFNQTTIDVKDAGGKNRRIPIMYFEWRGTIQELRVAAATELASRKLLSDSHDGKMPESVLSQKFSGLDMGDGEVINDEAEDRVEDEIKPADVPVSDEVDVSSQAALLYKELGYTPARQRAIEEKHDGDLNAILDELKNQMPAEFNPSPGEPSEQQQPEAEDDVLDDLFT